MQFTSNKYWLYNASAFILAGCLFFVSCKDSLDVPEFTESNTGPYILDIDHLQFTKTYLDSIPALSREYERLIKGVDDLLDQDYQYVVDKKLVPPSGSKNDYVSIARYWHLDSTGAQTIYKDGVTTPLVEEFDRPKLARISSAIYSLALAYYFSDREIYAEKAAELVQKWFINPNTRMRPNMNYSQIRLGVPDTGGGGSQGIIDAIDFIPVIDAVSLLYDSPHWSKSDHVALKLWFHDFVDWIVLNYNADAYETVNISTWMDVQRAIYYLFVEEEHKLDSNSHIRPIEERIQIQFSPEGFQPNEINRARSHHYVYFNLRAYMNLVLIRKHRGMNDRDWPFLNTSDFGGLKPGIDLLVSILNGEDVHSRLSNNTNFDTCRYLEIFTPASVAFHSNEYAQAAKKLLDRGCSNPNITLTFPIFSIENPDL